MDTEHILSTKMTNSNDVSADNFDKDKPSNGNQDTVKRIDHNDKLDMPKTDGNSPVISPVISPVLSSIPTSTYDPNQPFNFTVPPLPPLSSSQPVPFSIPNGPSSSLPLSNGSLPYSFNATMPPYSPSALPASFSPSPSLSPTIPPVNLSATSSPLITPAPLTPPPQHGSQVPIAINPQTSLINSPSISPIAIPPKTSLNDSTSHTTAPATPPLTPSTPPSTRLDSSTSSVPTSTSTLPSSSAASTQPPISSTPSSASAPPTPSKQTAAVAPSTPAKQGSNVTNTPSKSAAANAMTTQEKLEKAQKDLARLRQHLMDMEEQHTQETETMAERIAQLESVSQINEVKGSSQDSTIQTLTATTERLSEQLRERELDLDTTNAALYNLQNVLAQFQAQREEDIRSETQVLREEAARANQQAADYKKERDALLEKVKRLQELEDKVRSLQHELTEKTRNVLVMQEEVEPLRRAFNQTITRLSEMALNEDSLVQKRVVAQLVVTYLSQGKKQEVLQLMAKMLNFTEEELYKVGLTHTKGWIPFLRGTPTKGGSGISDRSVGDLWMEFLLKEVGDTQQQQQQQQQQSANTEHNDSSKNKEDEGSKLVVT